MENNFETKLAILADILDKKRSALLAILAICENQESMYATPASSERRDFLVGLGKEKQEKIDEVLVCDQVFQQIFEGIGDIFETEGQNYPEKVRKLQDDIKEVLEIDIKIRAQEEKTKALATTAWGKPAATFKEANPVAATEMVNKYRENTRNRRR